MSDQMLRAKVSCKNIVTSHRSAVEGQYSAHHRNRHRSELRKEVDIRQVIYGAIPNDVAGNAEWRGQSRRWSKKKDAEVPEIDDEHNEGYNSANKQFAMQAHVLRLKSGNFVAEELFFLEKMEM